jgi:hypothetical protein
MDNDFFSIEETNLMCVYGTTDRKALMAQIREDIADAEDDDMRLLMRSTLIKLAGMSDAEFAAIPLIPDDEDDETEV